MKHSLVIAVRGRRRYRAIVFDTAQVESHGPGRPEVQLADVLVDVNITRWGFLCALTHEEKLKSDPAYRQEVALQDNELIRQTRAKLKLSTDTTIKDSEIDKLFSFGGKEEGELSSEDSEH